MLYQLGDALLRNSMPNSSWARAIPSDNKLDPKSEIAVIKAVVLFDPGAMFPLVCDPPYAAVQTLQRWSHASRNGSKIPGTGHRIKSRLLHTRGSFAGKLRQAGWRRAPIGH